MSQLRALENRLNKLEGEVKKTPARPQQGILYSQDGGKTACDIDGKPLGALDWELCLRTPHVCVLVPPWCNLPLVNNAFTSRTWWLPNEKNKGDGLLMCDYAGSIPFEAILAGCRPMLMGPDPETLRLTAPWASWHPDNRTIGRWGGYYLEDTWLSLIEFLCELEPEAEYLYTYWETYERKLIEVYEKNQTRNKEDLKGKLIAERDSKEWQIRSILDNSGEHGCVPENTVRPIVDSFIDPTTGRAVHQRRLLLGNGTGGGLRAPSEEVLNDIAELREEIANINRQLSELRGHKVD